MEHLKLPTSVTAFEVYDANGVLIADCGLSDGVFTNEQMKANAERISKALNEHPSQSGLLTQAALQLADVEGENMEIIAQRDELLKVAKLASMRLLEIAKPTNDNLELYSALLSAISNVEGGKQ